MRIRHQLAVSALIAAVMIGALVIGLVRAMQANQAALQQQADAQDVSRDVASLLTLTNELAAYGGERLLGHGDITESWKRHGVLHSTA